MNLRRAGIVSLAAVAGCGSSPVAGHSADMAVAAGPMIIVTVSGSVNGTFPAALRVVYHQPAAPDSTVIAIVSDRDPGLGIASFTLGATLSGTPDSRHYDERAAQEIAALKMSDGRMLASNIDSMNTLDIKSIQGTADQADGSTVYTLTGSVAGTVVSTNGPDTVHFQAAF